MRFPNTVEINTFKAYINLSNVHNKNVKINSINLDWNSNSPESLRFLSIKVLADNWMSITSCQIFFPFFFLKNLIFFLSKSRLLSTNKHRR